MSEQYPQDLLDLGYSQEIIDEYDNDLLRTLDGLMPWEVPGAEYQGYGNPYASWWGGGSIPMDDPRRAEAARALYERTGTLYTPFGDANPTLEKQIQATVDRINKQGQFRFGDAWETYYFDPLKFLDISLTGDRGQADYSQFKSALTQDIQDYYQQYDPESLNWRDEAISDLTVDRYQNKGLTYENYLADRTNPPKTPQQSTSSQQQNSMFQSGPRDYVGLPQSPYANMNQNTMFGQNQASQQLTQSTLLNNLSSTINSQRANILNNLFGK